MLRTHQVYGCHEFSEQLVATSISFVEEIQFISFFHRRNKRLQNALGYEADVIVCLSCM